MLEVNLILTVCIYAEQEAASASSSAGLAAEVVAEINAAIQQLQCDHSGFRSSLVPPIARVMEALMNLKHLSTKVQMSFAGHLHDLMARRQYKILFLAPLCW